MFPLRNIVRTIWGTWDGLATFDAGIYSDHDRPLSSANSVEDIASHPWPDPSWFDYTRLCWLNPEEEEPLPVAEWANQYEDYARTCGGWNPVFSRVMELFGMEKTFYLLADRPDLIQAAVEQIGEFLKAFYRRLAHSCQGYADFLGFGDDFASQRSMLISPQKWREYFLPLWKSLYTIAHEHNLKVIMHSCGAVRPILKDLLDAGLEIFQVTQINAQGMDPVELKKEFGEHLTFYGGIDTQHLLPHGTPDSVRSEVRRLIDIMGRNGWYILCSWHFMMVDVPVENALTLYDEARSYRSGQ